MDTVRVSAVGQQTAALRMDGYPPGQTSACLGRRRPPAYEGGGIDAVVAPSVSGRAP